MAHRRLALVTGLLGAILTAPTALAGTPTTTTIVIDVNFDEGIETFTTDGALLYPSGEAEPFANVAGGGRQEKGTFTFHIVKVLTCDDGSGTFEMQIEAAFIRQAGGPRGGFSIVQGSGTGDYEGLRGAGSLIGEGIDHGILDHYVGQLAIG